MTTALALATPLPLRADDTPASALLDEAIWWPGDFGQVCMGDGGIGPMTAPYLPGFGGFVAQDYFLSKEMTERLKARRAAIVAELQKRLQAFDWEKVPAPAPVPKRVTQLKDKGLSILEKGDAGPGPWKPQNPHALGGAMLSIIDTLDAVELLAELMRLEEQLNKINEKAVELSWRAQFSGKDGTPGSAPTMKLPPIDLGGRTPGWDGVTDELDDPKKSKWSQWRSDLFEHLVFQREILGVGLQMAARANYAPLKDSLVGRLRDLGLRRQGLLNVDWLKISTKEEFTAKKDNEGLHWDDALGVPLRDDEQVNIPWSGAVRESARAVIMAYSKSEAPAAMPDGATLLREAIVQPGYWGQMCSLPPPVPPDVPLSPIGDVAQFTYMLSADSVLRLQAYRDRVIPALVDAMHRMDVKHLPKPSASDGMITSQSGWTLGNTGQTPGTLGPLVLDVVRSLNAVEALPELLRLEADLHELIVHAEKDPAFTPPQLKVDTWIFIPKDGKVDPKDPEDMKKSDRTRALVSCRLLQRKVLGAIWSVLIAEFYPSARGSNVEQAFWAAGTKATRTRLENARTEDDLKWWIKDPEALAEAWNPKKKKVVITDAVVEDVSAKIGARASIPYTEAARDEMRAVTEEYLRNVPPAKRKAGDAMNLPWLEPLPRGE